MQKKLIKTDLALVDEAKKMVNQLKNEVADFGNETREIISAKNRLAKKIETAKSNVKNAQQIVEIFTKQLKDLGIDSDPKILFNLKNEITKAEKSVLRFEKDFLSN